MALFSKFSKQNLKGSVERLKNKLTPETGSSNEAEAAENDQRFKTVSRELRILTARNIAQQIRELEPNQGKMSQEEIVAYAEQKSIESGWKDERILKDVAAMVTKLYHLGGGLPDHEL